MSATILIIDDEPKMAGILKRVLSKQGYEVVTTSKPEQGLTILQSQPVQIILCDLKMPGMDGIEVLERAKQIQPQAEFIMMTAYATAQTAVESMKKGAYDYLIKPFPLDELKILLARVLKTKTLQEENVRLREALVDKFHFDNIVAESKPMQAVLARVAKVAPSDASVLLRGESGTGKEILAKAIHQASPRKDKPLVTVNCSAIPTTLLESEMFGHVKGAFTGAVETRKGLFQSADGGTIFLDEIGEVSPAVQVKLLRVLQDGKFQRVGDTVPTTVDVRVIAATNKNLEEAIQQGAFRQDLYYRLNVVQIYIPPLRERKEDILPLIEHFARKFQKPGKTITFAPETIDLFLAYDWPGNIRELENAVEHAVVMGESQQILPCDLPLALQTFYSKQELALSTPIHEQMTLADIEKRWIINALRKTNKNHTRAAKLLGITRRTLGYRLQKYEIDLNKI
jgi:two-component system NtrC family response regulator